jgi:hypothetical protein
VLASLANPEFDYEAIEDWPETEVEDVAARMGFKNRPFYLVREYNLDGRGTDVVSICLEYPDDETAQKMAIMSDHNVPEDEWENEDWDEKTDGPYPGEVDQLWARDFSEQDKEDIRAIIYAWRKEVKAKTWPPKMRRNAPSAQPKLNATEARLVHALRDIGVRTVGEELAAKASLSFNSHVKSSLAKLVSLGIINNKQDVDPPGYGLPDWDH